MIISRMMTKQKTMKRMMGLCETNVMNTMVGNDEVGRYDYYDTVATSTDN
jgi:hypothetical protein